MYLSIDFALLFLFKMIAQTFGKAEQITDYPNICVQTHNFCSTINLAEAARTQDQSGQKKTLPCSRTLSIFPTHFL